MKELRKFLHEIVKVFFEKKLDYPYECSVSFMSYDSKTTLLMNRIRISFDEFLEYGNEGLGGVLISFWLDDDSGFVQVKLTLQEDEVMSAFSYGENLLSEGRKEDLLRNFPYLGSFEENSLSFDAVVSCLSEYKNDIEAILQDV